MTSAAHAPARVLGIDVGGTSMKAAFRTVQADGRLGEPEHAERRATPPDAAAADVLGDFAADLLAAHGPVDAVGVGVPGIVDDVAGVAEYSVAPQWADLPLRALLTERLAGIPVALGHDVRLGGLAEGRIGAARGSRDYLFVALGTGVGGMLCLDGVPRLGPHHRAGEIGHVIVDPAGDPCGCGQRGCLETIASATGIKQRFGTGISAHEVAQLAAAGDPRAGEVWSDAVQGLATALTGAITLLDLDVIVVGGGVAKAGEQLLAPLRAEIDARLTFQRPPRLVQAELGDEAAVAGAALIALDLLAERPTDRPRHAPNSRI
ncbi:ROK family protein [Actinospica robiniae]|uniref:ROK family protein n=1 Tax=Actinospica robiniae TaxID=304901 RepID=UPI0003FA3130|nr:ROK family protein [Actinospica robiniae]